MSTLRDFYGLGFRDPVTPVHGVYRNLFRQLGQHLKLFITVLKREVFIFLLTKLIESADEKTRKERHPVIADLI